MSEIVVRVVPNARRSEIIGLMGDGSTWRVRVAAPAVEGKANDALCRLIAARCGVRPGDVTVVAGATSRAKRVSIAGLNAEQTFRLLGDG